ncbi:MAG: TRAP transporter large permease [Limnochordia bacterium]
MEVAILLGVLGVNIILGVPLPFALGVTSLVALFYIGGIPLVIIPQRLIAGLNSFGLLAIPFFILVGALMNESGITKRIIAFSNCLVGHFTGGLALVNIVASVFFAGISGSATADTSAIGGILIPAMIEEGYEPEFAVAVTATSSTVGPIIPPSITMVLYGIISGASITKLFLGGYIPGLLLGLLLCIIAYIISRKRNYPKYPRATAKQLLDTFLNAIWALILPFLIIGGILSGIFTVTEAAGVAVVYSLVIGAFVYKQLTWTTVCDILFDSAVKVSALMTVAASALIYSWVLTLLQIPQAVTNAIFRVTTNPAVILLLLNLMLLLVGTFMEAKSAMIILVPVILPMLKNVGIDPVHFGVIMVFNLLLGLITPPVGLCLNLACQIAEVPIHKGFIASLPFFAVQIVILFLITYVPSLVMFLPNLVYR